MFCIFEILEINKELASIMEGVSIQENEYIRISDLRLLKISFFDFNKQEQIGELIVHNCVAQEVIEIFYELFNNQYPIDKIKLIDAYGGNDLLSMGDNNTSAFNYRVVAGEQRLSNHSYGLAIDINPRQNPFIKEGLILPVEAIDYIDRNHEKKGMIVSRDPCHKAFTSRGWVWGGEWEDKKDYHHFEKHIAGINRL